MQERIGKVAQTYAMLLSLFSYVALLWSSAALATPQLTPYEASFSAKITKGISLNGSAVRKLVQDSQGQWVYTFDVSSSIADIKERSTLAIDAEGNIQPSQYRYSLSGILIKDREQKVDFSRENKLVSESYRGKSWELPLQEDLLDRLSYQLQLQFDVSGSEQEFDYHVMHKGKIRHYKFARTGEETINTKLGTKDAILVEKVRDNDSGRITKLWFDKASPNILLRMIQVEPDGEAYEIYIESLKLL